MLFCLLCIFRSFKFKMKHDHYSTRSSLLGFLWLSVCVFCNCCAVLPNIRFVVYWVLTSVLHQVVYIFSFYLTFALRISLVLGSVDGTSNNGNKFFCIRLWSIVSICWWHAAVSGELAAALLLRHLDILDFWNVSFSYSVMIEIFRGRCLNKPIFYGKNFPPNQVHHVVVYKTIHMYYIAWFIKSTKKSHDS